MQSLRLISINMAPPFWNNMYNFPCTLQRYLSSQILIYNHIENVPNQPASSFVEPCTIFSDAGQYVIRFGSSDPGSKTGPATMIEELEVER
nr:hypothetical protein CFP56_38461 [Quercus suber]